MDTELHKIVLADGTELEATLNGNNYIFESPVDADLLTDDNIVGMTIDGEETTYDFVINHFMEDGKDHVIFARYSEWPKLVLLQRIADLESMAADMIGGVE